MPDKTDDPILDAFRNLSQKLAGGHDSSEILTTILKSAASLTGASRGLLLCKQPTSTPLAARAVHQMDPAQLDSPEMQSSNWLVRTVLHGGEGIISSLDAEPGGGTPASAILGAPLRLGSRVKGVLYLDRQTPPFTTRDLDLANTFATQAALVLETSEAQAALQSVNEAHSKLLSTITHELRVPMTSIKGYADILRQGMAGPLNDQQLSFLNTIRNNVERMSTLVSDISDASRINSGRLKLGMTAAPLNSSLDEAVHALQGRIAEKEAVIHNLLPAGLPPVHADPQRLVQVLAIMLGNAIKYGPTRGEIRVSARQDGDRMRVEVKDAGIGISEADKAQLFEAFFRSDDSRVREQPGWGLALHVAHGLVAAMDGEIGCNSTLNQGSTFWFSLPLVTTPPKG